MTKETLIDLIDLMVGLTTNERRTLSLLGQLMFL